MVEFELLKIEDDKYYYNYYPNGNKNALGCITMTENDERGIVKISEDDVQNIYAGFVWRSFAKGYLKLGTKQGEIVMF